MAKKKTKLTEEDIALSVMHHSLPVGLRAAVQSQCSPEVLSILDYALADDAARLLGLPKSTVRTWCLPGKGGKPPRLPWIPWHGGKRLVRLSEARALAAVPRHRGRPLKHPTEKSHESD